MRMIRRLLSWINVPPWVPYAVVVAGVLAALALGDPWYIGAGMLAALCLTVTDWDPYSREETHDRDDRVPPNKH